MRGGTQHFAMKELLIAGIFILIYVLVQLAGFVAGEDQASLSSLFVQPVAHSPQTQHCGESVLWE